MPNIYKVREEDSEGNVFLHHSSADVVAFDSSGVPGMTAENAQEAIMAVYNKAEEKAGMHTLTTTIIASAFLGKTAPYTQKIRVPGILETDNPDVSINMSRVPADALAQRDAFGSVSLIETEDEYITVHCFEDKPQTDIPINIRVFR
ncbi:MAG: hypothetical protein NC548_62570 [Lachnospiraceae bacterium]|nr:hypothetical protein [Lachnospiraceae bacterium]